MFDVAILGFGPTGSTLANLLGCWSARHQKSISVLVRIKLTYRVTHQDGLNLPPVDLVLTLLAAGGPLL